MAQQDFCGNGRPTPAGGRTSLIASSPDGRRWSAWRRLLLLLTFWSIAGCAAHRFDALMHDWEGHRVQELLVTWGPPQFRFSDGNGGEVVVYTPVSTNSRSEGRSESRLPGGEGKTSYRNGAATSQPVFKPSMTGEWPIFRMFFVDAGERIVRSAWRGRWNVP